MKGKNEKMKAEEQLQIMADFYPEDFPTRRHALNHLFCVVGNAYEWKNGELIGTDDGNPYFQRYKLCVPIKKAVFRNEEYWNLRHKMVAEKYGGEDKIPQTNKYFFKWSEFSKEYSKLYNYPKNIKPDWKALIEECKKLLREDGIEI